MSGRPDGPRLQSQPLGNRSSDGGLLRSVEGFWHRNTRPGGQFWSHHVNERMGSALGLALSPTPITPNAVTIAGLVVHMLVAIYVITLKSPVSFLSVAIVLVGWQLAFALDCTDGQLARDRGVASPFGAWLDQLADFVAKTAVYLALGLFVVRSLSLGPVGGTAFVVLIFAASTLGQVASAERNAIMGAGGGLASEARVWVRVLAGARHLSDYGAILFFSALLLLAPSALLAFLIATALVSGATVAGQVVYNWVRSVDTSGKSWTSGSSSPE